MVACSHTTLVGAAYVRKRARALATMILRMALDGWAGVCRAGPAEPYILEQQTGGPAKEADREETEY
jgi:hypothetical protein